MSSNLPPGVTVGMIPGNSPEDGRMEAAEEALMDVLININATPEEIKIALGAAVGAILAHRDVVKGLQDDWKADEYMCDRGDTR